METMQTKVYVERVGWSDMVKVWLGFRYPDGNYHNATVGKDGGLVLTKVNEGAIEFPPLLLINRRDWELIVKTITEQLPNQPQETVDAELKATKYHLEDMRKLVLGKKS